MVELYGVEILKENPNLLTEAARLLASVQPPVSPTIVIGDRSVTIGGRIASRNVIITGDQNKV